ncbi:MAG: Lrp/AsnC family transcriptional regulator [Chloroflexota bacterium]
MAFDPGYQPDDIDWMILDALQEDARQSYTSIGQQIGLSRPAIAERIKRLEDVGIISAYRAVIDPEKLGFNMTAFIRMNTNKREDTAKLTEILLDMPEVQQCFRGTGGDCFTIQVRVGSIKHLDRVLEQIRDYGNPTTTIMLASLLEYRKLTRQMSENLG